MSIDSFSSLRRWKLRLAADRGGGFAFGPPKSEAGTRVVPITEVIIAVIQCT